MNRENIDNKYKWDLSLIYKNEEELNKDINKLNNMVEEFKHFENHVMDSSKTLYESNKLYNDIARLSNKIYNYAYLKYDEDMGVSKNKILLGKLEKLISEISTKISFYIPEVLSYDYTLVKKYIDENKNGIGWYLSFKTPDDCCKQNLNNCNNKSIDEKCECERKK